jgi:hypothetical protein
MASRGKVMTVPISGRPGNQKFCVFEIYPIFDRSLHARRLKRDFAFFAGMKEVTTKIVGDNPDYLVETGCRSKINPGTDDEMTITGYRLVR